MTIKVDGHRPAADAEAARRVDTVIRTERVSRDRGVAPQADRVEVSGDAQLVARVMTAVDQAPAVRPDVVQRMRALIESGELGADSGKLADALIDHLLGK